MSVSAALRLGVAGAMGFALLFWNGNVPTAHKSTMISTANAVIGRPLTPLSYAGVARRTTRRAVSAGVVYGAPVVVAPAPVVVAPAPVVVAPRCVQAVDAYGRIYTRCY